MFYSIDDNHHGNVREQQVWTRTVFLLELLTGKKQMAIDEREAKENSGILISPLFALLEKCSLEDHDMSYTVDLILSCVHFIVEKNKEGEDSVFLKSVNPELLVNCIRYYFLAMYR